MLLTAFLIGKKMKKILLSLYLSLVTLGAYAQTSGGDAVVKQEVNVFLDQWHDDAANARYSYFDKMAKNGVYIGTDKTELWTRDAFKAWAKPYFERKSAWAFKAIKRNIYFSEDKKFIWFDELLATQMGICQASGVVRQTERGLEIEHYQLSIAVPNEVSNDVSKIIKEFEAKSSVK